MDSVKIISPEAGETTAQGVAIPIVWHKVDNAEWYGIRCAYSLFTDKLIAPHIEYLYSYDTTYTIPADYFNSQLYAADISVFPYSGPDPASTTGNVTGDYAMGRLMSYGQDGHTSVYGNSEDKNGNRPEPRIPQITARELIEKLLEK